MRSLIVGGPHDGDWVDVEEGRRDMSLHVRQPVTLDITPPPEIVEAKRAYYTRRLWRSYPAEWFIWAPPELSEIDVMNRLLRGYHPLPGQ
jgi:hypothetical protein